MTQPPTDTLFAAIDLGSNSFHMLVVRRLSGSVQTLAKIKRKVRLASGLDERGFLDQAAMVRGWQCLSLFAEHLQGIPEQNIRIVGTATLRMASNAETFLLKAEEILCHTIEVISGEEEARIIYQGVAHTSAGSQRRLVVDIGGASTELIVGRGFETYQLASLDMGCVLFRDRYQHDGCLDEAYFSRIIAACGEALSGIRQRYLDEGWDTCLGASGTVQGIQEVMLAQGHDERITLDKLLALKQQVIDCGHNDALNIQGLSEERKPVFPSGLAIMIALFQELSIHNLIRSGGALREGLVYEMLGSLRDNNVRTRTLDSLATRYQLDRPHMERVKTLAGYLFDQVATPWRLTGFEAKTLLLCAAQLHELGLYIDYVDAPQHAGYILGHSPLPGFTPVQKRLLTLLVSHYAGSLKLDPMRSLTGFSRRQARCLLRLLRIAVILAARRQMDALLPEHITAQGASLILTLPDWWQSRHPLTLADLQQESALQEQRGWQLTLSFQPGSTADLSAVDQTS